MILRLLKYFYSTLSIDSRVGMYIGMENVESSSHLFLKMEEIKRILIFYAVERCFKSFIELSSTVEPLRTF